MATKQTLSYQLEFFETLKNTANTLQGFEFVAFVILEIPAGVHFEASLVLGVGTKNPLYQKG